MTERLRFAAAAKLLRSWQKNEYSKVHALLARFIDREEADFQDLATSESTNTFAFGHPNFRRLAAGSSLHSDVRVWRRWVFFLTAATYWLMLPLRRLLLFWFGLIDDYLNKYTPLSPVCIWRIWTMCRIAIIGSRETQILCYLIKRQFYFYIVPVVAFGLCQCYKRVSPNVAVRGDKCCLELFMALVC